MRKIAAAAVALSLVSGMPAQAQNLNDIGRTLRDQLAPQQNDNDRRSNDNDRRSYEQGRRDQEEQQRRERDARRGPDGQFGRPGDTRRQFDDRDRARQQESDRFRGDDDRSRQRLDRALPDDQVGRTGRY